ncbi:MAG: FeoA family protein [Pseudohongiellaceae bacterium]
MRKTVLSQAHQGDSCIVLDIAPEPPELRDRLFALGVIPGSRVTVLRFAPLGDPIQLRVGASYLSIRRNEAAVIAVEIQ